MKQLTSEYRLERWIAAFIALLFLLPWIAKAQETAPGAAADDSLVRIQDVGQGSLLLRTSLPGSFVEAPIVRTDVSYRITGVVARATVHQSFRNPAATCVDATYVFPLPENAAVDGYRMTVGDRVIVGEIREKGEARAIYEQARADGRRASLVEQQRPNLFSVSISNLGAGETIDIELDLQQTIRWSDGTFSLRFPLVAAPRYSPANATGASAPVPTPPIDLRGRRNPVSISIDLESGLPLREFASSSHTIDTTLLGPGHYSIRLTESTAPSDRDFVLTWRPALGSEPRAVRYTEQFQGETYTLMMVFPPSDQPGYVRLPRETIFIIDTSGSMEGASIEQARLALVKALHQLTAQDRFDVIEFNSDMARLFGHLEDASAGNVDRAVRWVEALRSRGGTEMLPALQAALGTETANPSAIRQVIFITDGQVGNESELFAYISQNLGASRIFTVGIGSAPNTHLMNSIARAGRGTFTFVGSPGEVEEKMGLLFRKLDSPVLSDLRLSGEGGSTEVWPERIPDLYLGEPLVVTARSKAPLPALALSGRIDARSWNPSPAEVSSSEQRGIAQLWARQKIESLVDSVVLGGDETQIRPIVLDLALRHHLVSRYTSLVAVDLTPAGSHSQCESRTIPVNSPDGRTHAEGDLPQTATPKSLLTLIGVSFLAASALLFVAQRRIA